MERGWVLSTKVGSAEVGRGCFYRVGGDHFFSRDLFKHVQSSEFPQQLSSGGRETESEGGRARGCASSKGGRRPTKIADSSRSAPEGGVGGGGGCELMTVFVWMCLSICGVCV